MAEINVLSPLKTSFEHLKIQTMRRVYMYILYTRKKPKRSEKPLTDAVTVVRRGEMSVLAASKTFNVPRSTLILHL